LEEYRISLALPHRPDSPQLAAALAAAVPQPVRAIAATLLTSGYAVAVVGGCVRDGLLGTTPPDFDLATSAAPEAVLGLFPRAIPIGLRHGTVMIPSATGPVDVTRFRGRSLSEDLRRRDFTINAMALELGGEPVFVDPTGGHRDLAQGILRAPGDAGERLTDDPLRAIRAARFVAQLGVEPDSALREALPAHASAAANLAGERIRLELERLLVGPYVERGLLLLREIGVEHLLVPGVRPDAARITGAVPPQLTLRLAAWLRETQAGARLRKLRFPSRTATAVERRVAAHPARDWPTGGPGLRKLRRRLGDEGLAAVLALGHAEITAAADGLDGAAADRLERVEAALAELRRTGALDVERATLAAGGEDVMRWLGCRPGPAVGRALRWLTERVAEDPTQNDPERLRALLADYLADGASSLDARKAEE